MIVVGLGVVSWRLLANCAVRCNAYRLLALLAVIKLTPCGSFANFFALKQLLAQMVWANAPPRILWCLTSNALLVL